MDTNFDYQGYSEEKLHRLCSGEGLRRGIAQWKYWPTEIYSFGKHLRNYGYYPACLPIYCYSCHGVHFGNGIIAPHEIYNDSYAFFHTDLICLDTYKAKSDKPCYCIQSPFIWHRKKNKINKSKNSKGILAFPAHSTDLIDTKLNIEHYIKELKLLSQNYSPVCVCLHMHDINKGQHKIFMKHNIPVYTAGHAEDIRFAARWYDIVKNFSYTTSNILGSYTAYSIEMGIPFFLYGTEPKYVNRGDPNMAIGDYPIDRNIYDPLAELFSIPLKEVSAEQKALVDKSLGIHDGISRFAMAKVLYAAFLKRGHIAEDLHRAGKTLFHQARRGTRGARRLIRDFFANILIWDKSK